MNCIKIPNGLLAFLFMMAGLCQHAFAQNKLITGTVTDSSDGSALANVSITVKGTGIGTQTDTKGMFSLSVPASTSLLIISATEYIPQEINVSTSSNIKVVLTNASRILADVVMIGYGTARKKDLTGSLSSVSSTNFNKGIFASPDQLIQGKVSGLQITTNNGQPGGGTTIKIRGNSALSGTGQPLFVVDGVPLDGRSLQAGNNPLNFINPDDIASIDILKDASATAIYGSRAAYGVVIINTKKGQAGPPSISVAASAGVNSILKKIDVLNPSQFRDALKYYGANPALDHGGNTNAFNSILQHGFQQNYTVAISGGNENSRYRISGNVLDQNGIIKNTELKKYGLNFNGSFKFLDSKKLSLDINLNSNQYIQISPQPDVGMVGIIFTALRWNPTDSLMNANGSFKHVGNSTNPAAAIQQIKDNLKVTTVMGSISPSYKINSWLEYKLVFGINYSTGTARSSVDQDITGPGNPPGSATIKGYELSTSQVTQTLNFNKEIATDLRLTAFAGVEYTQFKNKGYLLSGNGVQNVGFGNYGLDYTNYVQFSDIGTRTISSFADPTYQLLSWLGRTIFNYKEKYLLTATFRADGSSKFGSNHHYGFFPSFAAAWNIDREKFFNVRYINSLKLRLGWGKTGNQDFPSGSSEARYSFFNGGVIRQVNNPNPDLQWQSDRQWNVGVDFSILNNRISGTIDYFDKTTTHLLFPGNPIQPAPPDAVFRWVNLPGRIQNKGVEVLITSTIVNHKNWGIDFNINTTFLKNNVSKLPAPIYTGDVGGAPVQIIENGYPMNTFFTRKFLGINKMGFSDYADSGATFYHVGNPNPKLLLGAGISIHYKKLSLIANSYGAFGQMIYYTPMMYALSVQAINTGSNIGLSLYKSPVKEALANPSQSPSSRFILKGNYLKMANLTFNYSIGKVKNFIKDMNLSVTGQNLFIITKYPGFNPETNFDGNVNGIPSLGLDAPHYPSSRTILVGLSFSL
jgi:iron complex outermembrane receptor protein